MIKIMVPIAALLLVLSTAGWSAALAADKAYHIGYLSNRHRVEYREFALLKGLKKLGYIEGKNLVMAWRFAGGRRSRLNGLATQLVRLKVDCIVASGLGAAKAAKKATSKKKVPVIIANLFDPVRSGIVSSLARPGGNITGFTTLSVGLAGKMLDVLKDAVPSLSRVVLLVERAHPNNPLVIQESQVAAQKLGLALRVSEVGRSDEFDDAFRAAIQDQVGAIIVRGTGFMHRNRARIIKLATRTRLPALYTERRFVDDGGLMSYGVDRTEPYRRAGAYIDKILKGTKPSELPVERPTKFELVINLKAAKALGLTVPSSLLIRADQVIE